LAAHLLAQGTVAGRESDQVGVEADALEDFPGLKKTVVLALTQVLRDGQGESGIQWKALVEQAMAGKVEVARVLPDRLRSLLGGFRAEIRVGSRIERCDAADLLAGEGERGEGQTSSDRRANVRIGRGCFAGLRRRIVWIAEGGERRRCGFRALAP